MNEEIEETNIGSQDTSKLSKIGKILEKPLQNKLIQSFHDYSKLFAWSYKDIPRLDKKFMVHNLVVKERGIYFLNRTLKEYETRYTPIEKS